MGKLSAKSFKGLNLGTRRPRSSLSSRGLLTIDAIRSMVHRQRPDKLAKFSARTCRKFDLIARPSSLNARTIAAVVDNRWSDRLGSSKFEKSFEVWSLILDNRKVERGIIDTSISMVLIVNSIIIRKIIEVI